MKYNIKTCRETDKCRRMDSINEEGGRGKRRNRKSDREFGEDGSARNILQ
jgi:hypothetical protein